MNEENNGYSNDGDLNGAPGYTGGAYRYTPPRQTGTDYGYRPREARYDYEAPADAYAVPEPPAKKKKKERRGMGAGAVIALCLVCALLASAVSAGVTYLVLRGGGRSALGDAMDAIVPTPVPMITTVTSGDNGAVNETAAAIYELAKQQVVGVRTDITYYNIFGQSSAASVSGSGVIITEDGYILTNHHVVEDAIRDHLEVTVMMYDESTYDAKIVGYDADNDLALLKIDAAGLNAAQLGDSEELTVGQIIYAVGNPLGELNYSMTSGIVSATDRTITTESDVAMNVFQIDAAVNSGNSGGPVYNSLGQVIGIVSAKYASTGVEGLGFAIPITEAAHIANQLLEYGYVADRAYLGVSTATVTALLAERYNMVEGAYVNGVNPGGAADNAGIREGDVIVAIDGNEVAGSSELTGMLKQYHAGDAALVTVNRDGEELGLSVVFDAKPKDIEENTESGGQGQSSPFGQYGYGDMEDFFRQFFGVFGR